MVWTEDLFNESDRSSNSFLITIIFWRAELNFYSIFIKEISVKNVRKRTKYSFSFIYYPETGAINFTNTDKKTREVFFELAPRIFEKENEWVI